VDGTILVTSSPIAPSVYLGADGLVNSRRVIQLAVGERTYTLRSSKRETSNPQIDAVAEEWVQKRQGHFLRDRGFRKYLELLRKNGPRLVRELVDDQTNEVVFYKCSQNVYRRADALIAYDDRRRLGFPVRGTSRANVIVSAVDESGTSVARFRSTDPWHLGVDIMISPTTKLNDDLKLVVALAAPMVVSYFSHEGGGG
jgi:hypothetical protein